MAIPSPYRLLFPSAEVLKLLRPEKEVAIYGASGEASLVLTKKTIVFLSSAACFARVGFLALQPRKFKPKDITLKVKALVESQEPSKVTSQLWQSTHSLSEKKLKNLP